LLRRVDRPGERAAVALAVTVRHYLVSEALDIRPRSYASLSAIACKATADALGLRAADVRKAVATWYAAAGRVVLDEKYRQRAPQAAERLSAALDEALGMLADTLAIWAPPPKDWRGRLSC
jgi:hypothetical protein